MSKYLQLHDTRLYVQNFNNDFLLLKGEASPKIAQIGTAIFHRKFEFVEEVIVTEVEICLKLNRKFHPAKIGLLTNIKLQENTQKSLLKLPVYFQAHEDWKLIESYANLSQAQIIEGLTSTTFDVAMFGFLPGFTYFNGLEKALQVPRKSVPAKYVPANSLAIGGKYLGLYSIASPGGWYVVGRVPIPILQLPEIPPVTLRLGEQIQLESISLREFERLAQQKISLQTYNNA